jgi:hypothetical protein
MSRKVSWLIIVCGATVSALAAAWFAFAALFRHQGAAWVRVDPAGAVSTDGRLAVVPGSTVLAQVAGFDSRADAVMARAGVWLPLLLVAVVLAILAWQVGRRSGRLAWADLLEPRGSQTWLVLAVAAAAVVPSLAHALAGAAVLRAAASPDGYTPIPVTIDWGWIAAAALLVAGRFTVAGARSRALRPVMAS